MLSRKQQWRLCNYNKRNLILYKNVYNKFNVVDGIPSVKKKVRFDEHLERVKIISPKYDTI